jgi:hypothetical protein
MRLAEEASIETYTPPRLKVIVCIGSAFSLRPFRWEIWDTISCRQIHVSYARYRTSADAREAGVAILIERWGGKSGLWETYPQEYRHWTCMGGG